MEITTKTMAPSPEQPLQPSLSGGQGGAKNLSARTSDTLTTDSVPGPSFRSTLQQHGSREPQSLNPNSKDSQKPGPSSQIVGNKESNSLNNKSLKFKNRKENQPTLYRNEMNFLNQLTATDQSFKIVAKDGTNLSTIDTIAAYEELKKLLKGEPKKINERRDGGLTIVLNNEDQSKALMTLKSLAGKEIICTKDEKLNQTQGTIRYENHPGHSTETIKECLEKYNVTDIYQMTKRNENRDIVKLPLYILTFGTTKLPSKVNIGWTHCSVRLYIPKPRRCFKCQRFGHGSTNCRSISEICPTCSLDAHEGECTTAAKCSNCKGDHPAYSRKCPAFVKEQEILAVKAHNNLSYAEAKRTVSSRYIEPDLTYSQATASQPRTVTNPPRQATSSPVQEAPSTQPNQKPVPIFYQTVNQTPPTSQNPQPNIPSQTQANEEQDKLPIQNDPNNNHQPDEEQSNSSRSRKPNKTNKPSSSRTTSSKRHMEHRDSSLERYPKRNNDKSYPIQMNIPPNLPNENKHPQERMNH